MHTDLQEVKLEEATIIVLYLLPEAIATIKDKLLECLERGCRIICQCWGIPDVKAVKEHDSLDGNVTLYLYEKST